MIGTHGILGARFVKDQNWSEMVEAEWMLVVPLELIQSCDLRTQQKRCEEHAL